MDSSGSDDDFPGERSNLHHEPGVPPPPPGARDPSSVDLLKGIPQPGPEQKSEPVDILSTPEASTGPASPRSLTGQETGGVSLLTPADSAGAEQKISSLDEGSPSSPSPSVEALDLNSTSPWVDFWNLFYRPKAFFMYFARVEKLPGWVTIKAMAGLCFLSWLTAFVTTPRHFDEITRALVPIIEELQHAMLQKFPWMFDEALKSEDISSRLSVAVLAFVQIMVVAKPFLVLFVLLLTAATAYFFLPMVGVPKANRSFAKLYVAGIFANWYTLVNVVPVLGPVVSSGLEIVVYTLAVKWMHNISFWRSFAAIYVLGWLLAMVTVVVMLIAFVVVFTLLGGA